MPQNSLHDPGISGDGRVGLDLRDALALGSLHALSLDDPERAGPRSVRPSAGRGAHPHAPCRVAVTAGVTHVPTPPNIRNHGQH